MMGGAAAAKAPKPPPTAARAPKPPAAAPPVLKAGAAAPGNAGEAAPGNAGEVAPAKAGAAVLAKAVGPDGDTKLPIPEGCPNAAPKAGVLPIPEGCPKASVCEPSAEGAPNAGVAGAVPKADGPAGAANGVVGGGATPNGPEPPGAGPPKAPGADPKTWGVAGAPPNKLGAAAGAAPPEPAQPVPVPAPAKMLDAAGAVPKPAKDGADVVENAAVALLPNGVAGAGEDVAKLDCEPKGDLDEAACAGPVPNCKAEPKFSASAQLGIPLALGGNAGFGVVPI